MGEQLSLVTVQIGQEDIGSGGVSGSAIARRLVWEKFANGPNENEIIVDLFPNDSAIKTYVTAGSLSAGIPRSKDVVEVLSFSNSDKVSLRYADASFLNVIKIGDFIDAENGGVAFGSVTHDSVASELTFNRPIYGTVKAEYITTFRRYTYTFDGSCPVTPPDIDPITLEEEPIFTDAILVAIWNQNDIPANATLNVSNDNDRCSFAGQDGEQNKISIEIVRSGGIPVPNPEGNNPTQKYVSVLRVIPAGTNLTLNVNEGVKPVKCNGAPETFKMNNEYLAFNNSFSVTTRYPVDDMEIGIDGVFTDEFGLPLSVNDQMIAKPKDIVNEGTWRNSSTFEATGKSRTVKRGEIILTDGFDNIKPAFGVLVASYTVTYDNYIYEHIYDNVPITGGIGVIPHARDAILTAKETGKVNGLIQIIFMPGKTIAVTGIAGDSCTKSALPVRHEVQAEHTRVVSKVWATSNGVYHSTSNEENDLPEDLVGGANIEIEVVHEIRLITTSGTMTTQHFNVPKAMNIHDRFMPYTKKEVKKTDVSRTGENGQTMQKNVFLTHHLKIGDGAETFLDLSNNGKFLSEN